MFQRSEEDLNKIQAIQVVLQKIGEQIKDVHELTTERIEEIAKTLPEWINHEFNDEYNDYGYFLWCEDLDDLRHSGDFKFKLQDGSVWTFYYWDYQCVLHPLFETHRDKYTFQNNITKVIKCDECGTLLRTASDILNKYESSKSYQYKWCFPVDWTDKGIEAWCEKREVKHKEYLEQREYKNEMLAEERRYEVEQDREAGFCHFTKECPFWDNTTYECELDPEEDCHMA